MRVLASKSWMRLLPGAGSRSMRIAIEFKLEDLWIGAFWRVNSFGWDLWICLLPCLPIHIERTQV